jgi:hypothetical protein
MQKRHIPQRGRYPIPFGILANLTCTSKLHLLANPTHFSAWSSGGLRYRPSRDKRLELLLHPINTTSLGLKRIVVWNTRALDQQLARRHTVGPAEDACGTSVVTKLDDSIASHPVDFKTECKQSSYGISFGTGALSASLPAFGYEFPTDWRSEVDNGGLSVDFKFDIFSLDGVSSGEC